MVMCQPEILTTLITSIMCEKIIEKDQISNETLIILNQAK